MTSIGVIDYGMGNLHSLAKALEKVAPQIAPSARVVVSADPAALAACQRLVLPGVGGVRACMDELQQRGLDAFVRDAATRVPLLGICLGMQVLLDTSRENGGVAALGIIPGSVERFPDPPPAAAGEQRLKVPEMGWNRVRQARAHPLWAGIEDGCRFYFVHSYYAAPTRPADTLGVTEYGRDFASAIGRDNIAGVQFHPEKSQAAGLRLLANFVSWNGETQP
ncbi:MAG: imidazole glycerol phosphate synthase subunit HisH [Nevskiaceae bacterium]|nr:MAG: imidazole glycerol phosphate synthase subunit HisH [Nevskiaceae bacterium]TBR71637.1 MAG: imidazole glycerol phosphate synthase subunit HisH [Nevskiaceae bacterium]